jgi:hypothetical protein
MDFAPKPNESGEGWSWTSIVNVAVVGLDIGRPRLLPLAIFVA